MEGLSSRFKKIVMKGADAVLNKNPVEVLVREATGNEHWGPTGTQMQKISQASYNYEDYGFIMQTLWRRLELRGKSWKNVYKALLVIDYLIKNGSDRVIDEFKSRLRVFQGLSHFQYVDEHSKDHGLSVRERSKILIDLLQDDRAIREARKIASKNREKYGQGIGSHHSRAGGSFGGSGAYGNGRNGGSGGGNYGRNGGGGGYGRRRKSAYDDSDTESESEESDDEEQEEPLREEKPAPAAAPAVTTVAAPVNPVTHQGWNAFQDSSTTMADPFGIIPTPATTTPTPTNTHPAGGFGNFGPAPVAGTPPASGFGAFNAPPQVSNTPTTPAYVDFMTPTHTPTQQNGNVGLNSQFGAFGAAPPAAHNGAQMNHPAVHGQQPLQASNIMQPTQPPQTGNLLTPVAAPTTQGTGGGDLLQPIVPDAPKKPADDPWSSLVDLNNITDSNKPGTKKINFKTEKSTRTIAPVVHSYGQYPVYHQ
mmetsp:Transcript_856/g.984  ORF Transcript_856/g.984 Transcript_856/m.984 type:complete len:478 (-) Transcript_856:186-1619(-)|eukprot:CAMPEP_0168523608 /NCGR_PEP_ID=MMETSP0405-20121227/10090_1 /TAXON_ID=498012 /ORGANISM="Trichosphaerium sp, Strain Am-I-7 wt" /LENGTH=477 /DNA_ID=CAMNT_0008545525 /DNA_START=165 /DNA_END=1598 /DNA_ORIENTATION=-